MPALQYLDFFDTVFIVLRKKDTQLSFLHVYHHATIGAAKNKEKKENI